MSMSMSLSMSMDVAVADADADAGGCVLQRWSAGAAVASHSPHFCVSGMLNSS
jgi:hypothetical protein